MGRKLIDEVGNSHGRLLVLRRAENTKHKKIRWLCRCNCGNEVAVLGDNLRNGNTKSCGCLRNERVREVCALPEGMASFNAMIRTMKRSAERRGYKWQLTNEQIGCLTKQPCYYCGTKPSQALGIERFNGDYIHNGIDRIDNAKGYTIDNVVPCCSRCNRAKFTGSVEQFRDWVITLHKHFIEKGGHKKWL